MNIRNILKVELKHCSIPKGLGWSITSNGCNNESHEYVLEIKFRDSSEIKKHINEFMSMINPRVKFCDVYFNGYSGAYKYITPGDVDILNSALLLRKQTLYPGDNIQGNALTS